MEFEFVEFNHRRATRGADAARVRAFDADGQDLLWMSKVDIGRNMMAFGRHPELVKAYEAYSPTSKEATSHDQ